MSADAIPWEKPFPFLWLYRAGPEDADLIAYWPGRNKWFHGETIYYDSNIIADHVISEYGSIRKESFDASDEPEYAHKGYRPPVFEPVKFSIMPKEVREFLNRAPWWGFAGIGSQVEIYIIHEGIEPHLVADEVIRGLKMAIEHYEQELEKERNKDKPEKPKAPRKEYYTPEEWKPHDAENDIPF